MYEVELKVELTSQERSALLERFSERGFESKGVTPQNDFYIEAVPSQYKGYDLKRYRHEADKYIYTEKTWEVVEGRPIRKEEEYEVSKEHFETEIAKYPDAIAIKKDRAWFAGSYEDRDISITIDTVKFDHSPNTRYFIEAEIGVEDKEKVIETQDLIREFLEDALQKEEIVEAPGMFVMAFTKQQK